jgi:hypothetical protein
MSDSDTQGHHHLRHLPDAAAPAVFAARADVVFDPPAHADQLDLVVTHFFAGLSGGRSRQGHPGGARPRRPRLPRDCAGGTAGAHRRRRRPGCRRRAHRQRHRLRRGRGGAPSHRDERLVQGHRRRDRLAAVARRARLCRPDRHGAALDPRTNPPPQRTTAGDPSGSPAVATRPEPELQARSVSITPGRRTCARPR